MKSTFGTQLQISLFGESHGAMIGVVMNGLAPGIPLDLDFIRTQLEKRRPQASFSTTRQEEDEFQIVSGFFNGYTTGTPLCVLIPNTKQQSKDYSVTKDILRPSHSDFTAFEKYFGFQDYRGGGHFSGRVTAPLVIAGAICLQILKQKGIELGSHIIQLNQIHTDCFANDETQLREQIQIINSQYFPCLNPAKAQDMMELITQAKADADSVGGILQSVIIGMPAGIGEPFFDSIESTLGHLLFSVPAVKGVEFGLGFDFANYKASEVNDAFRFENGIKTTSNHNGGINGGISNGMPILIKTVIKPTSSILREQQSVNYATKENVVLKTEGRHDPAIIHRARVVVDSVIAIGLVELFTQRFGYLWMRDAS